MPDLNRSERRALSAAVFLVGLSTLSRALFAPSQADVDWEHLDSAGGPGSPRLEVSAAVAREARALTPLDPGETIDVSVVPAEELRRLPGVGPSLAEAIVRERTVRPFQVPADLERVPGIGPATLDRLRDRIVVGAAPGGPPAARPEPVTTGRCAGGRVDVNGAGETALRELPGVGPALARRMIEHRTTEGSFRDRTSLDAVPGFGPALLARLEPLVCFR